MKTFEDYKNLTNDVYHRVSACTSCDPDFVDDSMYTELSVANLIYNHFCDRYVQMQETPYQYVSEKLLREAYDQDPEYAYAYMMQFKSILDKYHVENCDHEPNSINLNYIK